VTVDRRTLSEQVYQSLRADILSGRYPPRTELSEVALADSFGTSRGPVREAIRRLWAEGLVLERPRRGAVVASLSKKDFENAYQVRSGLEVMAVTLGTPLRTEEALRRIDELIEEMDEQADANDEERFFVANRGLHREICALADNPILIGIYDRLINTMERYSHRSAVIRGDLKSSVDEHRAIVEAIRRGDVDDAASLTQEHISIPLRKVEEMSEQEWEALL
jgi:DNA-binding GntR family transcriptional regulator